MIWDKKGRVEADRRLPQMTSLAALLGPDPANEAKFKDWAGTARASDLPDLHAFTRGLDLDQRAVTAAVTLRGDEVR